MSRGYHVVLSGDSYSVVPAFVEDVEVDSVTESLSAELPSGEVAQCQCGSALMGECEECEHA